MFVGSVTVSSGVLPVDILDQHVHGAVVPLLGQGQQLVKILNIEECDQLIVRIRPRLKGNLGSGQQLPQAPEGAAPGGGSSDPRELVLGVDLEDGDAGADGDQEVGEHVLGVHGLEGVGGGVLALELQTDFREV